MNLNGSWRLHITDGGAHDYDIEARVPGCAHTDLMRAGILPDLFWRKNNDLAQWVENCDAVYSREFFVETVEKNSFLVFEGLDTYCDVFLNGSLIGSAEDMFIPYELAVDGVLQRGVNHLEVHFRSPIREVADCPKRQGAFTTERINTRRLQCTYGWDWVARFVTMGIWKEARLEVRRPDRLENVYVFTKSIYAYGAKVGMKLQFAEVTGNDWVEFEIKDPDGRTVYSKKRRILTAGRYDHDAVLEEEIDIRNARLWYPIGYGDQPLYTLTIRQAGTVVKDVVFGIRTAEILELEDEPDSPEAQLAQKMKEYPHLKEWDRNEGSSSFILLVNGVRIFCSGANWVPAEPFVSEETDEKLAALVELAKAGNVRMLRVWGGGIFEHDAFYSACDRLGILVTQDFLMACGTYPEEEDDFIDKLKLEARAGALALRNHPCLMWWSGDNENAVNGDENQTSYTGRRAALEAIGPVLAQLDPHRRFLPSSPYGGVPYASGVRGTSHNTQYLGHIFSYIEKGDFSAYRQYFDTYLERFCAEQPAMGMPYVSTLRKFMTDEDIFGEDTEVSEYHTKSNPALKYSLYEYIDRLTRGIFGEYKDGEDRVKKMQMLQCERIRLSMELFRRNAWYSSGLLYWMFNDCWPAANSWSIVDYYCAPKPAYYAFKRASKALITSVTEEDGEYRAWVSHTGKGQTAGKGRLYVYDVVTGEEPWELDFEYEAVNEAFCAAAVCKDTLASVLNRQRVLLCEVEGDRAYFLPGDYLGTAWEEGGFALLSEDEDSLTVRAEVCLPMLLLDVPCLLEENGFFMKKGEIRVLKKVKK